VAAAVTQSIGPTGGTLATDRRPPMACVGEGVESDTGAWPACR